MEKEMEYPAWRAEAIQIMAEDHGCDPHDPSWDHTPDFLKGYWEDGYTPKGAIEEDLENG